MSFELPPGAPLEQTNQLAQRTEAILLKDPAVEALRLQSWRRHFGNHPVLC